MYRLLICLLACLSFVYGAPQSNSSAGTLTGTVSDPSGASVPSASIEISSPITTFSASAKSDPNGAFRIGNVPPNTYVLKVVADGFMTFSQKVDIRSSLPQNVAVSLQLGQQVQTVEVQATGALVENEPSDHTDVDRSAFLKLPTVNPAAGLSDAITYSVGGVSADSNGSFHPEGDHAQVTFVIDGQPLSDQQSKTFSTQLPTNAIQSMELVTGSPGAEFGDKSSLVVNAMTRSGLGAAKAFGNLESTWSSFGTWGGDASMGFGSSKWGEFLSVDGLRSGRFLDTPEFLPIHDIGNNERIFDRLDFQPTGADSFHLNLFTARNWFQVPNSYDQLAQDQRQRVLTWNIAPGYQHTFNSNTIATVNLFARRDQVNYYGSRDPFADTPIAVTQNRFLTNYGAKADISHIQGRQEFKAGIQIQQTRLVERFTLGITDPLFIAGAQQPSLLPYDLTRGGQYFLFHGKTNIDQYGVYIQDRITLGHLTVNAGLRGDQYNGLSSGHGIQPRLALSYLIPQTDTVLRVAYSRTFETPFNENLILSSAAGAGGLQNGLAGNASPIRPGNRNQFNAGFEQKIGKAIVVDADYFWKYTHNAYDFNALFNTPITFPISWHNSKLDGFDARVSTTNVHGFQGYLTLGHTRARYFGPEDGGLISQSVLPTNVFRIDHDQNFQSTMNVRYQRPNNGLFVSFIWRYDSGMVAGAVPDVATALTLTGAQQADIGFHCGATFATLSNPILSCPTGGGATLLRIPAVGTENNDSNPPRIAPRNLLDAAVGTDNLLHSKEKQRVAFQFQVANLTNKVSFYNFLSTFSGTHFVQPRTYEMHLGYVF